MIAPRSTIILTVALLAYVGTAQGADVESMKTTCRERAAKVFGVPAATVEVKYEGQRIDKTHAVNGSALVRGESVTFQCSFAPKEERIATFVRALAQFEARGFGPAAAEFAALPPEPLRDLYLARCERLIAEPPGAAWTAALEMHEK